MNFPASYDDTKIFEENNKVCVMVYTTNKTKYQNKNEEEREDLEIIRDFVGNPDYYENDNINLLRISDDDDNSHYRYINNLSQLLNVSAPKKDTDNYCPYCNTCFDCFNVSEHIKHVIRYSLMMVH